MSRSRTAKPNSGEGGSGRMMVKQQRQQQRLLCVVALLFCLLLPYNTTHAAAPPPPPTQQQRSGYRTNRAQPLHRIMADVLHGKHHSLFTSTADAAAAIRAHRQKRTVHLNSHLLRLADDGSLLHAESNLHMLHILTEQERAAAPPSRMASKGSAGAHVLTDTPALVEFATASPHTSDHTQYIVMLKAPVTHQVRHHVNAYMAKTIGREETTAPPRLGQYLPHNAFLMQGPADSSVFVQTVMSAPSVLHCSEFLPQYRLSPALNLQLKRVMERSTSSSRGDQEEEEENNPFFAFSVQLTSAYDRRATTDSQNDRTTQVQETNKLIAHWTTMLNEHRSDELRRNHAVIRFDIRTPHDIGVTVSPSSMAPLVASWVLHRREVAHLSVDQSAMQIIQNSFVRYVVQSDVSNRTDIWDHHITGENQIVALADTGIDHDSCFFRDPNIALPVNGFNPDHRKIIRYKALADDGDDRGGHGSHVACTLTGRVGDSFTGAGPNYMRDYNGMAKGAKLIFYDVKKKGENVLMVPKELYSDYYADSYKYGARVSSNSWGAPDPTYDAYSFQTDRFAFDHPDFLPVFAAGNYGSKGFFSLASPGVAKNVLTVGATKSMPLSFHNLESEVGINITSPASIHDVYQAIPADFGPKFQDTAPAELAVVMAEPKILCTEASNGADMAGKIVLVERGVCDFTIKVLQAQVNGARLVIVYNDKAGPPVRMHGDKRKSEVTIPSVMISREAAQLFKHHLPSLKVQYPVYYESPDMKEDRMPSFSSRGPTYDGRLKPDIMSVGQFVVSMRSDGDTNSNNCRGSVDLMQMEGTSMATPSAAGAAVLVRQYFMDGYYPSGRKTESHSLIPSAALIKAMLIQSGVAVSGTVEEQVLGKKAKIVDVTPPPSRFQGYGRMKLDSVLPFNSTSRSKLVSNLLVVDDKKLAVGVGDVRHVCIRVKGTPQMAPTVRATLVWVDPVAHQGAQIKLVNDLDLFAAVLEGSGGEGNLVPAPRVYIGNSHHDEYDGYAPWDNLNNVEQVHLDANELGPLASVDAATADGVLVSVHVRGSRLSGPSASSAYALVVSGTFAAVETSECANHNNGVVCPRSCSGHGVCNTDDGLCECVGDYTGADCSVQSNLMTMDANDTLGHGVAWTGSGHVSVNRWSYYHFNVTAVNNSPLGLLILLTRKHAIGDPDIYVEYESWPGFFSPVKSTACDPCGQQTKVYVPKPELKVGVYRIGVYGYCCDAVEFRLDATRAVDIADATKPRPTTPERSFVEVAARVYLFPLFIAGMVIVILYLHYNREVRSVDGGRGRGHVLGHGRGDMQMSGGGGGGGVQWQRLPGDGDEFDDDVPAPPHADGAVEVVPN